MVKPGYAEMDAIPRSLNALALLASGNADHLPLVKKDAEWAAGYSAKSMQTWYYGYCMVFLAEYVLATGDESVLPGLKRLALEAAKGQSAVGSWGHGFAIPDGRLGGYGMMNSPGVVLTIGLVLAREAGVKDADVSAAIERSAKLLRFYTGKGAIPYGDHSPWVEGHSRGTWRSSRSDRSDARPRPRQATRVTTGTRTPRRTTGSARRWAPP
ncbi:MAG: DUF6288 domain-containing protein [Fimbriiglobus sp.]|nr:DUF6288 domain-containing protein [Fimbriiglobus sp.]